ncbi:metallophosphoesterase [Albimonas sp. CAU 1670]|uniref:metallophosphoesterase n=1 Tax=Albimonas sp. CAU 1670 TaxID=3032599 RepID=UPI0023DBDF7D|nr:metallophosphoesterase [Albimonas sp. CAU 1670]MDF2232512.1 metallophosphoesterase [Albimonas sp. CAU 1670]
MRIAQITDSHIVAPGTLWKDRVDMAAGLAAAVARLNEIAPDLVVHTGDVVDGGGEAQYGLAAEILSELKAPLRLLPGNHDLRDRMRAAFGRQVALSDGPFLNFAEEAEGLTILGLDTIEEGQTAGRLCAERAAWLRERLARGRPALVFAHHPPCPLGLPFMDRFTFRGSELAAEAIQGRGVLRIATGHVHAAVERHWAGTLVAACPATGVQIPPAQDGGWPGFALEPAAIRLHDWSPALGLTVKTVPVEPGPFHPFEADPNADFSGTPHAE